MSQSDERTLSGLKDREVLFLASRRSVRHVAERIAISTVIWYIVTDAC